MVTVCWLVAALAALPCLGEHDHGLRREDNQRMREARQMTMVRRGGTLEIRYQGRPLRYPWITHLTNVAVHVNPGDDGAPRAHLRLGGCAARELRVDDELVDGLAVRAIVTEGVLLERGDALYFMPVGGQRAPDFRMVWRASFSLTYEQPYRPATPASPPPRKPAKRGRRPPSATRRRRRRESGDEPLAASVRNPSHSLGRFSGSRASWRIRAWARTPRSAAG